MENVWANYRWYCSISRRVSPEDPYTLYCVQHLRYELSHPEAPRNLKIVIGWSNDNDDAKPFYADPTCLTVWEMSWLAVQPIHLEDKESHAVEAVEINGELLTPTIRTDCPMKGGAAYSYDFQVPPQYIGKRCNLSVSLFVRKIASMDGTINVITRMKQDCDDAAFLLSVDGDLEPTEVFVYTTEVSPLFERFGDETSGVCNSAARPRYAWARFRKVIQKGSNIRFEVRTARYIQQLDVPRPLKQS